MTRLCVAVLMTTAGSLHHQRNDVCALFVALVGSQ